MALANAVYTVVSLPTLAKSAVIASTGTAFGTNAASRRYVISTDLYAKQHMATRNVDIVVRTPNPAVAHPYTGSGWLTFSGAAAAFKYFPIRSYTGAGTLTFSGTASTLHRQARSYTGSGRMNFAGSAPTAHGQIRSYTGSGTLRFSGTAPRVWTKGYSGGGALHFSGSSLTYKVDVPWQHLHQMPVPQCWLSMTSAPVVRLEQEETPQSTLELVNS